LIPKCRGIERGGGQQLLFVIGRIDEIGRVTGGWLKQVEGKTPPGTVAADVRRL